MTASDNMTSVMGFFNPEVILCTTCLLFPFLDGGAASDMSAVIAILSSAITVFRYTVLLPCVQAEMARATRRRRRRRRAHKSKKIRRKRRTMDSLRKEHGNLFGRAYRMNYTAFLILLATLTPHLPAQAETFKNCPNGHIPNDTKLAVALRYFAGGSVHDIKIAHGISKTAVYDSVWAVVNAVNESIVMEYPSSHDEQREIAKEFENRSVAGFTNCGGCIDGMLVWIEKPTDSECARVKVDSGKFYCGRKGKYGLNMQGVCDARRRFLDISLRNPASASDYLSFITSDLKHDLATIGFLAANICLFGDNAYVNSDFMAVPYLNTQSGFKDDYNFFHSQVRINVECSFGILVNRWRILKSPLPATMSIEKVTALVKCLCKLHNFCIDQSCPNVPGRYRHDAGTLMDLQDSNESESRPLGLLGGGSHFDDVLGGRRSANRSGGASAIGNKLVPRERMLEHVVHRGIHRPAANRRS
jgi:hypothetical protein